MQTHMKLKQWTLVVATLVIGLGTGVAYHVARADSSVDCSGLPRWNSDHTYKKGDLVWYPDGPSYATKQQCILDKCHSVFDHSEPGAFSKAWKQLGTCKSMPRS